MVDKVRSWDRQLEKTLVEARNYENLEQAILVHIMGVGTPTKRMTIRSDAQKANATA